MNEQQAHESQERRKFLASKGIKTGDKDISLAVHTLQSIQAALIVRLGEVRHEVLTGMFPEIKDVRNADEDEWLAARGALCACVSRQRIPVTNWEELVFAIAQRVVKDGKKTFKKGAFIVRFRVMPILESPGQLRLEMEHKGCPFPEGLKLMEDM